MKRYIKTTTETSVHLTDLFSKIHTIVFVPDVREYTPSMINASEDIEYEDYTDDELRSISQREVEYITNIEVLKRLHKLTPNRLTKDQKRCIRNLYREKIIIDKSDVVDTLNMLKQCNRIYTVPTMKNSKFEERYNIKDSDKLKVVHKLKASDYINNTIDFSDGYSGNCLMVFMPHEDLRMSNGWLAKNTLIYLKIDITQTLASGSTVAIVSFHESIGDENRPYK